MAQVKSFSSSSSNDKEWFVDQICSVLMLLGMPMELYAGHRIGAATTVAENAMIQTLGSRVQPTSSV